MDHDFGVIYVATGEPYIREAVQSAASVRQAMPHTPVAIWVDDPALLPVGMFDHVRVLERPTFSFFDKIEPLVETPFAKTLFLDTDTWLLAPIDELAPLMDRFDLAYCHAPYRSMYEIPECSSAFAEPNTGVIAYRRTRPVCDLLRAWADIYRRQLQLDPPPMHDQPAFRLAVYQSALQFTILPSEYNLRTVFPWFAGGNLPVKILHGREPSLSAARKIINQSLTPRVGDARPKGFARIAMKLQRKARQLRPRWSASRRAA